jgi:hypothetical protein
MKRLLYILYSLLGASFMMWCLLYLAGVANLSMNGFTRGVFKMLPVVAITGGLIGLSAMWLRPHGCLTALVAGIATIIAALATTLAIDTKGPIESIPIRAYAIGVPIGVLFGIFVLGIALYRSHLRLRRSKDLHV